MSDAIPLPCPDFDSSMDVSMEIVTPGTGSLHSESDSSENQDRKKQLIDEFIQFMNSFTASNAEKCLANKNRGNPNLLSNLGQIVEFMIFLNRNYKRC